MGERKKAGEKGIIDRGEDGGGGGEGKRCGGEGETGREGR